MGSIIKDDTNPLGAGKRKYGWIANGLPRKG
jgi:hypothetical protein